MSPGLRSVVLAATAFGGSAFAGDPVRLDKAAVERALPGKTLNYANVNGASATVTFHAGGRVVYKTGNATPSEGTWVVEDNGRYCIKITSGPARDHCRYVWKTDSGYALGFAKGDNLVPLSGLD